MSKSQKTKRNVNPPAAAAPGRRYTGPVVVLLAIAVVVAAGFWWSKQQRADAPPAVALTPAVNATNQPAPAATPTPDFAKLKGKWLRPDGGYILEIRNVEPGGKIDAAYLNPRPINVEKAEATQEGPLTKVFIVLRDVNYPGSTYTLTNLAGSDQLEGIYFQAAIKQEFEVVFQRMK